MIINALSRLRFSTIWQDEANRSYFGEREPFGYRDEADNIQHVVQTGDTLFNLAGRYYSSLPRAAGLWWAIADFQPDPVHDPTVRLVEGTIVVVPSVRLLQMAILNQARREFVE